MYQSNFAPELHKFPLSPEAGAADMSELADQARERLAGTVLPTPLEPSAALSYGDNTVLVKRADRLPGGCFKYLSAMNSVAVLVEAGHENFSLATAGSYGIGVAHAINTYGGHATAFVPEGSNPEKRGIMRAMGVEVVEQGGNFDETDEYARGYAERQGLTYLHPFASLSNWAGTGVIGLEVGEQCPDMTDVVLQFGGGSLFNGVGSVIKQWKPDARLSAVQVKGCSPFVDSVRTGEVRESRDHSSHIMPSWFARLGGVGVGRVHPMTLGGGSQLVDRVDIAQSSHVYATMHDFQQEHGVLPEFAAAVSLEGARRLARSHGLEGATIVAVLTGNHPDDYLDGYLEGQSDRRRRDEAFTRTTRPSHTD